MLNIDRRVRHLLAGEAERTIDAALASGLVEAVARSMAEHHVPERVGSDLADQTVEVVLRSPVVRAAVAELIASDEVRRGIGATAVGFGDEIRAGLDTRLSAADDRAHAAARRAVRAAPAPEPSPYGGVGARTIALVLDLALVQAVVVVGAASVSLVLSLAGAHAGGVAAGLAGGAAWLLTVAAYFAAFWSVTGQTPGMRVLGLRLATPAGALPSLPRSLVRFAGLLVAIVVPVLGVAVPLVSARRRGLQDVVGGTLVSRAPGSQTPSRSRAW